MPVIDFVIATGQQTSVREFVVRSAQQLGITLAFEGEGLQETGKVAAIDMDKAAADITLKVGDTVVAVDEKYYRPSEVETLLGDPARAKEKLGWEPSTTLDEMIQEMMENDLVAARKDRLLLQEGYEVNQAQE